MRAGTIQPSNQHACGRRPTANKRKGLVEQKITGLVQLLKPFLLIFSSTYIVDATCPDASLPALIVFIQNNRVRSTAPIAILLSPNLTSQGLIVCIRQIIATTEKIQDSKIDPVNRIMQDQYRQPLRTISFDGFSNSPIEYLLKTT